MKIVWTVSRHYNHNKLMVPLMELVTSQLVDQVRDGVDHWTLFRGVAQSCMGGRGGGRGDNLERLSNAVSEAKQILEAWRLMYAEVQDHIKEEGPGLRRWEFKRAR